MKGGVNAEAQNNTEDRGEEFHGPLCRTSCQASSVRPHASSSYY